MYFKYTNSQSVRQEREYTLFRRTSVYIVSIYSNLLAITSRCSNNFAKIDDRDEVVGGPTASHAVQEDVCKVLRRLLSLADALDSFRMLHSP